MSEQEKFQKWWDECGFNSVILRAWMARAKFNESTSPQLDPHIALMEAEHKDRTQPHPAEDPDEWVILDPVKYADHVPRTGIDWFMNGKNEWVLQASSHDSRTVGDHFRWCDKHHRCRRRDLPKVEQCEPNTSDPACPDCGAVDCERAKSSSRECSSGFEPGQRKVCGRCGRMNCESLTQPQKTRVRLWMRNEPKGRPSLFACDQKPFAESDKYIEIHHDADGFYVENKQ